MIHCKLSSWRLDSGIEPTIRVGLVLPQDKMDSILVKVPDQAYTVSTPEGAGEVMRSTMAKVTIEGGRVVFLSEAGVVGPADEIRLAPEEACPPRRGAGVQLRGVMTGRGFHWEKRMHPTIPGTIEFTVHHGYLIAVNELPLEEYLPGVIAGEMSGDCPLEFLKSQCLVARAWVLALTEDKHPRMPFDRCNDDCCQRYHGTTEITNGVIEAVQSTRGQVLVTADGQIVDANYSKSCGGISELPEHVWGVRKPGQRAVVDAPAGSRAHKFMPVTDELFDEYLTGDWLATTDVFCSPTVVPEAKLPWYLNKVDEGGGHFRWRVEYNREDLESVLRQKFFARQDPARVAPLDRLTDLQVQRRGVSGRAAGLEIAYLDAMGVTHHVVIESEYAIREALHEKFLYSSAFRIDVVRDEDGAPLRIAFVGAGWGHGAGLCQIGALGMALTGLDCETIVKHYFEDIEIRASY